MIFTFYKFEIFCIYAWNVFCRQIKSNLEKRLIIFVMNELLYSGVEKKTNCDFSEILQFSEKIIVLITKTET